jgi:LacI family transcriptional regulator
MLQETTVARVREAATNLGYQPNPAAVSLTTGRKGSLGVVLNALTNPLYGRLARSLQRSALDHGLGLQVVDTFETDVRELELLSLLTPRVDGIISVASRLPAAELLRVAQEVPLVVVNRRIPGIHSVVLDVASGTARAVDHLADLGHEHLTYVHGPAGTWSDEQRRRRVRERAKLHHLTVELIGPAPPTFHAGVMAAERSADLGVTAILAYNSLISLGVLYRLASLGLRVPADMSLVSGDDMETLGVVEPGVSALHLPIEDAARAAVGMLLAIDAGVETPESVSVPVPLVPRSTSGPLEDAPTARP